MAAETFAIQVPDAVIADLVHRLDATRWPDELENAGWELGSNLAYMRSLAEYWRHGYNWRREEAVLNQLPQFRISLEGFQIHFVHVRRERASAVAPYRDARMARELCRDAETDSAADGTRSTWWQVRRGV